MLDITPSKYEREHLELKIKEFLSKFKDLKNIKIIIGGSYAKNTWLSNNRDVDVFFKFEYKKFVDKDISSLLKDILLKKYTNVETVHGSRDYYHIIIDDVLFEVVPVLDIKKTSEAKNIMDVSPMHVDYIKKKLNSKMCDEVRKLKLFCKANDIYGAESYVRGFSGYVLEVLISYYKSIEKLMKSASEWKDKVVIDPAKLYKKNQALILLNQSKISSLILIDPVQKDRNAAAALSQENFLKFVNLAKQYDGSERFFVKKEIDVKNLKDYIVIKVEALNGKEDIVYSKLFALFERVKNEFIFSDFPVSNFGWKFDNGIYFWFKSSLIEKTKKHYGPSLDMIEHVKDFKKKHKNTKVENGRVYAVVRRKFSDPELFIKYLIKQKWFKEKVKNAKLV
ncbi:nucleotidyltransferase domain-containing protein [Candidatus Woesearchaeota archaeon]|nr:nucleotidyltransferase domain-containing protein [Candidatus Woesearchaeota archaeon]